MKATIIYMMQNIPHPWDNKMCKAGIMCWCLVKITIPEIGNRTSEPVAMFNYDSEAETFQGHVYAMDLDEKLVTIDRDCRELFNSKRNASNETQF